MDPKMSRRAFLTSASMASAGLLASRRLFGQAAAPASAKVPANKALIAITLDLEMARNFPAWEDSHWDYEKGNQDDSAKKYAREAARRVKAKGGVVHFFCVGRVFEQENVDWLKEIAAEGHPIGNHTYDHMNVWATRSEDLQFRYQRAPWLIDGMAPADVIRQNIRWATAALKTRGGIDVAGFRTPGGSHDALNGREDLQKMLLDLGFTWVSSLYPDHPNSPQGTEPGPDILDGIVKSQVKAQPYVYPTGLIEIPMSPVSDIHAYRVGRWKVESFVEAVGRAVDWTIENGAVFDFLAHPSVSGVKDPDFRVIDLICDKVAKAGDRAAIVDLNTIAKRVAK